MTPEDWQKVTALCAQVLEQPPKIGWRSWLGPVRTMSGFAVKWRRVFRGANAIGTGGG